MSKYEPLRRYLEGLSAPCVPLTFAEIERIVGFKLPDSKKYPAFWSNNPTNNVMTTEWLEAGFRTEQVDVSGKKIMFRRVDRPDFTPQTSEKAHPRRNPAFGCMKGMITIMPGVDLTEPADPDWGRLAYGDEDHTDGRDGK